MLEAIHAALGTVMISNGDAAHALQHKAGQADTLLKSDCCDEAHDSDAANDLDDERSLKFCGVTTD